MRGDVTADRFRLAPWSDVRDPEMKRAGAWRLSTEAATAKDLTGYYGSRWGIEFWSAGARTSASAWGWDR